jgi:Mitochondrial genome maintenance MGM101
MTTLARRALLRFPRPSTLYRPTYILHQRTFTVSHFRRQAVEETPEIEQIETSLNDAPIFLDDDTTQVDWSRSFHGLSTQPFSEEAAKLLTAPLEVDDVEIKPG